MSVTDAFGLFVLLPVGLFVWGAIVVLLLMERRGR